MPDLDVGAALLALSKVPFYTGRQTINLVYKYEENIAGDPTRYLQIPDYVDGNGNKIGGATLRTIPSGMIMGAVHPTSSAHGFTVNGKKQTVFSNTTLSDVQMMSIRSAGS